MNIRTKLTLTFFSIVIVVLSAISFSIYFFSSEHRQEDFYRRLKNRATNTAKVLMEKEVDADLLKRMERNNPASLPNQYITIYNNNNEELYASAGAKVINVDKALLNRIQEENEIRYRHNNYEVLGFLFNGKDGTSIVVAAATDVYGQAALENLRDVLIITFGVSIVFVSILGWMYAGKVLRPVSQIVNEVSNITEANLSKRLNEGNRKDELSKLSQTFNRMLERLQSAFAAQKNFIANASHEIKTPITLMSSEIEVTLLQERDKEFYKNVLKSVLEGLKGLNALSTQLLLLAQTSAEQPEKNFTLIRIDDILWEMKEELRTVYPHYIIDILFDLHLNHESLLIDGDEQLMKVAVLNLMDNGCKYSNNHQVSINLTSKKSKHIAIEFTNTGIGIKPDDIDKIFAPFFRGKNNKKVKGFGIGLSLVKRIAKLHNGEITVESKPQEVTRFTLMLPIRK